MRAIIAGYGYLGQKIAGQLVADGFQVTAIRRTPTPEQNGIKFVSADLMQQKPGLAEVPFDVSVFCLAPGTRAPEFYRRTYVVAQQNFLGGMQARYYVYISSTGVYPDAPGTYSEDQGSPHTARAEALLEAEAVALEHPQSVVLRLAGLYSRERPIYSRMSAEYTDDKLIHFIHRDDAAYAVLHSVDRKLTGVFNVHDGNPQWRSHILRELGLGGPTAPGAQRSISGQKFAATGFQPEYSNYLAGIRHRNIID